MFAATTNKEHGGSPHFAIEILAKHDLRQKKTFPLILGPIVEALIIGGKLAKLHDFTICSVDPIYYYLLETAS
jgi:hypothetical protein